MMIPNLVSEWVEDGTLDEYMESLPRCSNETCEMVSFLSL